MANIKKVNDTIDLIMKSLIELKNAMSEETQNDVDGPEDIKVLKNTSKKETPPVQSEVDLEDFEALKKALESDKWPEAVNPNLICDPNNESDKLERGRGIVELMIEPDLKGLKVLDIGCGEGHVAFVASEYEPTTVVGYDIKENKKWEEFKKEKLLYTTNFNEVLAEGPFDVIVLFDVLDHVKGETPIELLKKAKNALAPDGQIYMRCHPYTSKHATHLYHQINKAYIHLVFSEEEIKQLISDESLVEENIGVTTPMKTYENFIQSSGLTQVHRREITSKVDPFFKIPRIAERVMKSTKMKQFPEYQMGLDFIDYVLKN